jgi:hypothetical protein
MVVGYLDVGAWNNIIKFICAVQGDSPIGLEDPKEKDADPFSVLEGCCTFMAYWEESQQWIKWVY